MYAFEQVLIRYGGGCPAQASFGVFTDRHARRMIVLSFFSVQRRVSENRFGSVRREETCSVVCSKQF